MRNHKKAEDMSPNKISTKKEAISAVNSVPEELFSEDFKLKPDFFELKSMKEADARNEIMGDYLEKVESFLIANVAENFDFFSQSFECIRDMEIEMGDIKFIIQDIRKTNDEKREQITKNMVGVYFLNRRMTIMKQIREHLVLIKILKESIPVIRNLIKNGSSFNTVMELTEKSYRLINEKLQTLNVAMQLKDKIQKAEVKSKKRIEEEFKALIEANFNSNIQFNSWLEDENWMNQIKEFCAGDFRQQVLEHIKFNKIFESWSFYLVNDKQAIFGKFRFLIKILIKMGQGDDLVNQIKVAFNNNSKRFYHLMLDYLMSKIQVTKINNKKDVFAYLDCEEILPSFMLLYLVFSGIYISLDRLNDMFKEIVDTMIADEIAVDTEDCVKSQKSSEENAGPESKSEGKKSAKAKTSLLLTNKDSFVQNQKRLVYFKQLKEDMRSTWKQTANYFVNKFIKWLKSIESKTSSININELYILKRFFEDMCSIMQNKYEIPTKDIERAVNSVLLQYLDNFAKKKKDTIETLLRNEIWKNIQVAPFFQEIIRVMNDLQISDEEYFNFDQNDSVEPFAGLRVNETNYIMINSTLELTKAFYDYVKVIRYFDSISSDAASSLIALI